MEGKRAGRMARAREIERQKRETILKVNREIVANGVCPDCGLPLFRNSALPGWYQCAAYPGLVMRKEEFKNAPKCDFQIFRE